MFELSDLTEAPTLREENERLEAEIERLREWIGFVVEKFEKDEAQGYHTKDRQFALAILRKALSPTEAPSPTSA
jgi:regulator of replication initiation timing